MVIARLRHDGGDRHRANQRPAKKTKSEHGKNQTHSHAAVL